jgi:subtilisin family serine protease
MPMPRSLSVRADRIARSPRRPASARAPIESLEGRRLMSATAVSSGIDAVSVAWNGQTHLAKPGSWVVGFERVKGQATAQLGKVNALLARTDLGVTATRHLGANGLFEVDAADGEAGAADVRAAVSRLPGFRFLEPDFVLQADATTANDPYYAAGHLWGLNNTGQSGGLADADIDAPEAWDLARGNGSTVVGVIDSGVDYNHPDLAANIWTNPGEVPGDGLDNDANGYVDDVRGWDFANRDNNPMDDNGHGTHVAGTIAGAGNNGVGVTGVNWNARIVPLKFMNSGGTGYLSDAVAAINYATALKQRGVNIRVTNNSWAGGAYSSTLYDAIRRHNDAGVMFVAAAGNNGQNVDTALSYPSAYNLPNVVAVAATDRSDVLGSFSNYGATQVDLAAPGVSITSTARGGGYATMSGTSMAAPHVAGAAALGWAYSPGATVQGVRDALLAGVDKPAALAGKVATGGRLNAFNTLKQLGAFTVAGTTPAAGSTVTTRTTRFTVNFTRAHATASVQAADFKVNGLGASSVVFNDADTVTFVYSTSPVKSTGGTQAMQIAAGAITSATGAALPSWSRTFTYAVPTATTTTTKPAAPTTLAARTVSTTQLALTWQDRSTNEAGFKVERSADGGATWLHIATTAANATSYTATGLTTNKTYHFRVRAYNAAGHSAYTNTASATTRVPTTSATAASPVKAGGLSAEKLTAASVVDLVRL